MDCSGLSTLNSSREKFKSKARYLERNYQVSLKNKSWADHLTSPVGFKSGKIKNKMNKKQVVIVLDDDEDEEGNIESKASDDTVQISSEEDSSCNNNDESKRSPSFNLDKELNSKLDEGKNSNEINANYSKDFNDWFNKKLNSAPWLNKNLNLTPPEKGAYVLASVKVPDKAPGRPILEHSLMNPTRPNFNTGGNFSSLVNQSNASKGSSSINLTSSHTSQNLLIKSLLTNNSSSVNMLQSRPILNVHNAVPNVTMQQPVFPRPIAINVQIPASSNDRVAIVQVPASTGNTSSGFQPLNSVSGQRVLIAPNNALVQQPHSISNIASNSNASSQIYVVQSMAEASRPSPILNPSLNTPSRSTYTNIFKSTIKTNFSNIINCSVPEPKTINNLANSYSVAPNSIQITGGYSDVHCKVVSNITTSTANVHELDPNRQSIIQYGTNIQGLDSNTIINNQSGSLTSSSNPFQSTQGTPIGISFNPVTSQTELVCITDTCCTSSSLLSSQSCQTDTNSNQTTKTSQSDALVASKLLKALESGILKPLCNIDSSKISWKVVEKNKSDEKRAVEADKNVFVIDDSSDEDKGRHVSLPQSFSSINSIQKSSSNKISINTSLLRGPSVTKFVSIKPKIVPVTISNESAVSNKDTLSNISNESAVSKESLSNISNESAVSKDSLSNISNESPVSKDTLSNISNEGALSKDTLSNISSANGQTRNTVITNCSKLEPEISVSESDSTLSKLNYFKEENQCNEDMTSFGHRHKRQKLCLQEETSSQDELNLEVDSNLIPHTVKPEITTIELDCDDIKDNSENVYDNSRDQTNLEVKHDLIPYVFKEELPTPKLDYDDKKYKSKDDDDVHSVISGDLKNEPSCSNVKDETGSVGSKDNENKEDSSCVDVKPFACSYCGFRVAIESNLEMHIKAFHVGKKAKSMPILKKNNNPPKKINALVVKTQMFRCFVCDYCTYRASNFNLHLMSEHDIYSCNKCSFMVDNSDELRSHENIHRKGGKTSKQFGEAEKESFEMKCELCDFNTLSQTQMIAHTLSSHSDQNEVKTAKVYECDKCTHKCALESDLVRHKITHTDRCRFPCDSCGFRASSQESLVKHQKQMHSLRDPIFCCYCDFSTDSHVELREHKHISHPSKFPFACKKCNFRTSKDSILDRHLKLDHGTSLNEPSTLKITPGKSNFGDNSLTPVKGHSLSDPVQSSNYQCNICSFSTSTENGLKKHMTAHDNLEEKLKIEKYKCNFCKFKSDKIAVLNKHRYESHLNEHPYSCTKCIFRATIPYKLMRHEQTVHNIKRKYYELHECSICDFRTSEPSLLAQHKNHAHSSKFSFKCSYCQYYSNSASQFLKHCKTVHRNKISRNIKDNERKLNTINCASGSSETNKAVDRADESQSTAVIETRENESSALFYYCQLCDYKTKCCVEFEKHKVSKHCKYAECDQCPFIADSLDGLYCHSYKVHSSVYLHKCSYCNFCHSSKQTVSTHTKMHSPKACYYCEFKVMSSNLLDRHIHKVHPEKQLENCSLCGYKTAHSSLLTSHVSKLHEILTCTVCSFSTHSQYEIFKHKYTQHPHLLPYACHECNFRAQDTVLLDQHKLEVHNKQCCRCDFKAPTSEKLNFHIYVEHTSDYYLKCLFCNYFAESLEDLYKHESNFHNKLIYRCTRCFFFVDSKDSFLSHILICHPKSDSNSISDGVIINRKVCGYCDFSTLSSSALYKHFGSCHSAEYPWKCDKCYYRSKIKRRLTEHENSKHVDKGQFKACQFCEFRAEKKCDVRTHEFTIHSNKFPLSCDLCSYRAKRNDYIVRHKTRWHSSKRR